MPDHISGEWWQQFIVTPDVAEIRLRLAVVQDRVVMAQVEVVDPRTSELLGLKSHPAIDIGRGDDLVPIASALIHEALRYLRGPFPA